MEEKIGRHLSKSVNSEKLHTVNVYSTTTYLDCRMVNQIRELEVISNGEDCALTAKIDSAHHVSLLFPLLKIDLNVLVTDDYGQRHVLYL